MSDGSFTPIFCFILAFLWNHTIQDKAQLFLLVSNVSKNYGVDPDAGLKAGHNTIVPNV